MKIGILTFHKSVNNGAVIQCWSLSKRLKEEFPEAVVEVIDYHMPKSDDRYKGSVLKYFKESKSVKGLIWRMKNVLFDPRMFSRDKSRKKRFDEVADVLPLSKESIYDDGCDALFDYINSNYDMVVVGSDAIWNFKVRGFPNPYFLSEKVTVGKFSYAASCYGMSYECIPEEQSSQIKAILDSYRFLGVRDIEAQKFAEFVGCEKQTVHTCDPTVFVDTNKLPIDINDVEAKLKKSGFRFDKKSIAVMASDPLCRMIKSLYGEEYQIVALYNYCKSADVNLYNVVTPYEWAYIFKYFKLTVTTFFHGTLLSLRNLTPVVCIGLPLEYSKNHKTKVEDVLERVGLQEFYIKSDYADMDMKLLKQKADNALNDAQLREKIRIGMDKEAESISLLIDAMKEYIAENNIGGNQND